MFYSKYLDENRNYFTFTIETNTSQFDVCLIPPHGPINMIGFISLWQSIMYTLHQP